MSPLTVMPPPNVFNYPMSLGLAQIAQVCCGDCAEAICIVIQELPGWLGSGDGMFAK